MRISPPAPLSGGKDIATGGGIWISCGARMGLIPLDKGGNCIVNGPPSGISKSSKLKSSRRVSSLAFSSANVGPWIRSALSTWTWEKWKNYSTWTQWQGLTCGNEITWATCSPEKCRRPPFWLLLWILVQTSGSTQTAQNTGWSRCNWCLGTTTHWVTLRHTQKLLSCQQTPPADDWGSARWLSAGEEPTGGCCLSTLAPIWSSARRWRDHSYTLDHSFCPGLSSLALNATTYSWNKE